LSERIYELDTDNAFVGLTFVDERNFVFPIEKWFRTLHLRGRRFDVEFDSTRVKPRTVKVPEVVRFSPGFCCFEQATWLRLNEALTLKGDTVRLSLVEGDRDMQFVLFEPSGWYNCLDFEKSVVRRFDEPPYNINWVDRVVLKGVSAVTEDIFRVKGMTTRLFCTEECVRAAKKLKLTGFDFRPIRVR
jgi:hypothetical protein